jgi:AcrR family transcriptional regulator
LRKETRDFGQETERHRHSDRRVNRTRKALRKALIDLIREKSYDQITVEEITERANLGRTTFYLHYKDKEDLLLEDFIDLIDEMVSKAVADRPLQNMKAKIAQPSSAQPPPIDLNLFRPNLIIFQNAARNADLLRIILHNGGVIKIGERLREIILKGVQQLAVASQQNRDLDIKFEIPVEVIANFYAGSLLGLISWWLDNDMPHTPEQMTLFSQRLFFLGLFDALGIDSSKTGKVLQGISGL